MFSIIKNEMKKNLAKTRFIDLRNALQKVKKDKNEKKEKELYSGLSYSIVNRINYDSENDDLSDVEIIL